MGPKFGLQSERLVYAVRGYKETQEVGTVSEWAKLGPGVETKTTGLESLLWASGLCRLLSILLSPVQEETNIPVTQAILFSVQTFKIFNEHFQPSP